MAKFLAEENGFDDIIHLPSRLIGDVKTRVEKCLLILNF